MPNRTFRKTLIFAFVIAVSTLVVYLVFYSNPTQNGIESTAQPTSLANAKNESDFSLLEDSKPPMANDVGSKTGSSPQHELAETSESAAQGAASRAHTPAELMSFINAPAVTVESVDLYLGQDDVAVLVRMLGDPRYQNDWKDLALALSRLDEGTEAQHAIIHLIQRGDVWPRNDRKLEEFIWVKINAVGTLGYTNGDVARRTARNALTESGALKLAQEWIGRELPGQFQSNPERVVALIRGRAAMGLVYSLDEESVQLVESLYGSVAPRVKKQRERQRENSLGFYDLSLQEQSLEKLFTELVSALATRDLISDVGYDRFITMSGDHRTSYNAVSRYFRKYLDGYQ